METRRVLEWMGKYANYPALLVALSGTLGCTEEVLAPEHSGRSESGLTWVNGWNPQTRADSSPVLVESSAAACETRYGSAGGQMIAKKDANNKIAIAWKSYSPWSTWANVGNSAFNFSTRPACASLDGPYDPNVNRNKQVALVSRGSGMSRYWLATWKLGNIGAFGVVPSAGTLIRDWHLIANDQFASAPAVTVHNGKLLVAGRKSNNSLTMFSYPLNLSAGAVNDPYTNAGSWTTTAIPALPNGWTAINDPAMVHAPAQFGSAMLIVLATGSSGTRLYRITTANGTTFGNWASIPMGIGNIAVGSPSLDLSGDRTATFRHTAYVMTGVNLVYEGSSNPGSATFSTTFQPIFNTAMADGPAAIGGVLGSDSTHTVFAKGWGSDQLMMTATNPSTD